MTKHPDRLPVTVVVPTKNEASQIGECLSRLAAFEDVVVLDSGSSDATAEIAEAHGATVINFAWNGRYPKKRNWFLLNQPPKTPWVLFLDADEFLDGAFCQELAAKLSDTEHAGFWLRYSNTFLGKELKHGVPQRKLALLRVGAGLYERIEEDNWSQLDMEIHEHPILDGSQGEIKKPIEHREDRGLDQFLKKHLEYAAWEANRFLALLGSDGGEANLTKRQSFKYRHLDRWWFALFYFVYTFFVRRGFLDYPAGWHYAAYKAWYFRTIRLLIREHRKSDRRLETAGFSTSGDEMSLTNNLNLEGK